MATTTNYGWTTPNDTDLVKDGAAAIRTLGSSIDTTVFNNAAAGIAKTIVDAKGDIIAATAADTVARLAVGTDGQVLKANSATATGLEWGSAGAAGKSFALLNTGGTALSGNSTVTISSLSGYDQFLIIVKNVSGSNNRSLMRLRFSGDTGLNYSMVGGTNSASSTYDVTAIVQSVRQFDNDYIEFIVGPSSTATTFGAGSLFVNGANTSGIKVFSVNSGFDNGGGSEAETRNFQGYWNNSSVISSVTFFVNTGTFDAGTIFIYGAV